MDSQGIKFECFLGQNGLDELTAYWFIWWYQSFKRMYSPQIRKHTRNLYRLSKVVGKPMTHVADDLMGFSFKCLKAIYTDLGDDQISEIIQQWDESEDDFGYVERAKGR